MLCGSSCRAASGEDAGPIVGCRFKLGMPTPGLQQPRGSNDWQLLRHCEADRRDSGLHAHERFIVLLAWRGWAHTTGPGCDRGDALCTVAAATLVRVASAGNEAGMLTRTVRARRAAEQNETPTGLVVCDRCRARPLASHTAAVTKAVRPKVTFARTGATLYRDPVWLCNDFTT